MFWIIYLSLIVVLITVTIILYNNDSSWFCLTGLIAYIFGLSGLYIWQTRPTVYIVKENGDIEEHKYCIRRNYILDDGTRLTFQHDSTYIINEGRLNLCLEEIPYCSREYFNDTPWFTKIDTVQSRVLSFYSQDVSAFTEPPPYLDSDGRSLVHRITLVSLERQHLSPAGSKYRSLLEPEDDSWLFYSYFTNN